MWEPNPGPLQGQQVLFASKPCLLSVLILILNVICEASNISEYQVTGCFKIHINRLHVESPSVCKDQEGEDSQFTLSLLARISWEISGSPGTFLEHFYHCLLGLLQGGSIEYPVTRLDSTQVILSVYTLRVISLLTVSFSLRPSWNLTGGG